jgi:hypothetical protein
MSKSRTNARISNKINGVGVVSSNPAAGQSLVYTGTAWSPGAPTGLGSFPAPATAPVANSYIKYTGSGWTYATLAPVKITAYSGAPSSVIATTIALTGSNFTSDLSAMANVTKCTFNYVSSTTAAVNVPLIADASIFLYLVQTNGQFAFIKIR